MKKIFSVLAAAMCLTVCAFSFTACGDNNNDKTHTTHNWSATYTEDGDRHYQTCDGCDEKKYSSHDYGASGVCVCGKHKPETPVAATGVSLNKEGITLEIGGTATLTATVAPENATDKSVIWESDKPEIATVSNGEITAVKEGAATITAKTANGKTATCTVTVSKAVVLVTGVELNKTELTLEIGDEETLTATVSPENATDKTVAWTVAPAGVVSMENGVVTAIKDGTATITATAANNKTATCSVTVNAPITNADVIAALNEHCLDKAAKKIILADYNKDLITNGTWFLTKNDDGNITSAVYRFNYKHSEGLKRVGLAKVNFSTPISAKDLKDGNITGATYSKIYDSIYHTDERTELTNAICEKLFNTDSSKVVARYLINNGAELNDPKVDGPVQKFKVIEVTDEGINEANINIASSANDEAYAARLDDESKYRVFEEASYAIEGQKLENNNLPFSGSGAN